MAEMAEILGKIPTAMAFGGQTGPTLGHISHDLHRFSATKEVRSRLKDDLVSFKPHPAAIPSF